MVERRRDHRTLSPAEVVGTIKASVPARILDLSVHGMQVEVGVALQPSADHNVTLPAGEEKLQLRARVQWCRATPRTNGEITAGGMTFHAGLSFLYLSEEDIHHLEDLIVDLSLSENDVVHLSEEDKEPHPIKIRIPKYR